MEDTTEKFPELRAQIGKYKYFDKLWNEYKNLEIEEEKTEFINTLGNNINDIDFIAYYWYDILNNVGKLETEEEKTEFTMFVANLSRNRISKNGIIVEVLQRIKSPKMKERLMQSLENCIDPEIEPYVQVIQQMMREFFEDYGGEAFEDYSGIFRGTKRENFEIVLRRTDAQYGELDDPIVSGRSNHNEQRIIMYKKKIKNKQHLLLGLIHEYGHLFSYRNFLLNEKNKPLKTIEEGIMDIFAELVLTHYLEKHGSIYINGEKIEIDNALQWTGYEYENNWMRTILYPAYREGKLEETVMEYLLGSRWRWSEKVLGDSFRLDNYTGLPSRLEMEDLKTVYLAHKEAFGRYDSDSLLAKRNSFLPILRLQKACEARDSKLLDIFIRDEKISLEQILSTYFGPAFKEIGIHKILGVERTSQKMWSFLGYFSYTNKLTKAIDPKYCDRDSWWKMFTKVIKKEGDYEKNDAVIWILLMFKDWSREDCKFDMINELGDVLTSCFELGAADDDNDLEGSDFVGIAWIISEVILPYEKMLDNTKDSDNKKRCSVALKKLKVACLKQIENEIDKGNEDMIIQSLIPIPEEGSGEVFLDPDIRSLLTQKGIALDGRKIGDNYEIVSTDGVLHIVESKKNGLDDCILGIRISYMQQVGVNAEIEQPTTKGEK